MGGHSSRRERALRPPGATALLGAWVKTQSLFYEKTGLISGARFLVFTSAYNCLFYNFSVWPNV